MVRTAGAQDGGCAVVVPDVVDRLEDVNVAALPDRVEEAPADNLAPPGDTGGLEHRVRPGHGGRPIEEDVACARVRLQHGRQKCALAPAHIDDRARTNRSKCMHA